MMKVVISGAAGFIGSHLAERALAEGHDVTGIDNFSSYYARQVKEDNLSDVVKNTRFRLIEEDIVKADLSSMFEGFDVIYHLAAQAGVRASWGEQFRIYTDTNILGTQRILEAARSAGVRRVVYASSSSVYGDADVFPMHEGVLPRPVSPYGVSKLAGENLCVLYAKNYGLSTVSMRYFTVYGPRQRPDMAFHKFIKAYLQKDTSPLYGSGDQTRDFTYISDAVEATYTAGMISDFDGRVFNIGGGSRVSVNQVLTILEDLLGGSIPLDRQAKQKGDVRHTAADTSAAASALMYSPKVTLKEGLQHEIEWMKKNFDRHIGG